MSLTSAFLLDPHPFHVWITVRSDSNRGSGTQNDPYDGGNAARFDAIMSSLPAEKPVRVHLGPSPRDAAGNPVPFLTSGFWLNADGTPGGSGWQPRANMEIVGSGIDVTFLKLEPGTGAGTDGRHYFAIGASGDNATDFFTVSGLTIDCALPSGANIACGAIRVMGHHARIRDVKCINWGNRTTGATLVPGFVIACLIVDGDEDSAWLTVDDVGIERCIAVEPSDDTLSGSPVHVLHIGGRQLPTSGTLHFGRAPFIRDCFVDATFADPPGPDLNREIRALSMTGCHGGIVEGNSVENVRIGGPWVHAVNTRDLIVRSNVFHNVGYGVWCHGWGAGPNLVPQNTIGDFEAAGGGITVTMPEGYAHNLAWRAMVRIEANPDSYSGVFDFFVVDAFSFAALPNEPPPEGSGDVTSIRQLFGIKNLLIEANTFELTTESLSPTPVAIQVDQADVEILSVPEQHGPVTVRNNRIRYVDGASSSFAGYAMQMNFAKMVNIIANVIDTFSSTGKLIELAYSSNVALFDNRRSTGEPADVFGPPSYSSVSIPLPKRYGTPAEEVLLSANFNK